MWSSETISCRWLLALGLALPLGGCFQPLYGGASGTELQSDLAAIAVDPIPDRLGHYLGNDLIFALNGTGSHVTPKYRLTIVVAERVQTPLVNTFTGGQATAATVGVDANYKLTSVAGDRIIAQGTAFTAASYDRTSNNFANTSAAGDAEIRDAQTLADQIKTRIAIALRNEKQP